MAAPVGNLQRRLEKLVAINFQKPISEHLNGIRKTLEKLQPYLRDAEWKRDLRDAKWRMDSQCAPRKIEDYERVSRWISHVAFLAIEVEDILVTHELHLSNMATGSIYSRVLSIADNDNVCAKIQRFLSRGPQYFTIPPLWFHSRRTIGVEDSVSLLGRSMTAWMGLEWLFGEFSDRVIYELQSLIWKAVDMQLVRSGFFQAFEGISKIESGRAIHTILESVSLVGRGAEINRLKGWLQMEEEDESTHVVIGVTGEAGIGKTALAAACYERGSRFFDCHAWIFVSPHPSIGLLQDMLKGILKSLYVIAPNDIDGLPEWALKEMIRHQLAGKKFLLVLDDVSTQQVVDYVFDALPLSCSPKVICTSRETFPDYDHVLRLSRLSPQNSFNLLHKRACLEREGSTFWSSVQAETGEILRICDGLPLAIATVGGLLSTKQMMAKEWTKIANLLSEAHFLPLCFADLRPELKSCFLYAASFPSHSEISYKRLQRLWVAEGFVPGSTGMKPEEGVKLQLEELIRRNMIQVARVGADGGVKTCRLLRRMQEFALQRNEEDKFCTLTEKRGNEKLLSKRTHRLFFHIDSEISSLNPIEKQIASGLYSFIAFRGLKQQPYNNINNFKLLSVLELQQLLHENLPDAIGNLGLLQYLGLRGTKLKTLPSSCKKLIRLQTLDIRDTFVKDLPAGLESLKMSRHLLLAASFSEMSVKVVLEIDVLENLQTLSGVQLTSGIAKGLRNNPHIQKLSVCEVHRIHSLYLCEAIDQMQFLRSLTIKCALDEQLDLTPSNESYFNLEKLRIGGRVQGLLDWVVKLHALKYLYVWDNRLEQEDPLSALQHLPNLVLLSLCNAYDGQELKLGARGFLKLKKLSILHCKNLHRWEEIKEGALRRLQILTIAYCPKLFSLPSGLEKLPLLQALMVSDMPVQFVEDARNKQSTLSSNFSLIARDTIRPVVRMDDAPPATKRLPKLMPAERFRKKAGPSKKYLIRNPNPKQSGISRVEKAVTDFRLQQEEEESWNGKKTLQELPV